MRVGAVIKCDNCARERELCEHRYPSMTLRLCRDCSLELVGTWPKGEPESKPAKTLRGWAYVLLVLGLTGCNEPALYAEHPGAIRIKAERELIEPTTRAAARLEQASGLGYQEGEFVVPVRAIDNIEELWTGAHACAVTGIYYRDGLIEHVEVLVDRGVVEGTRPDCSAPEAVILHELMHVHRAFAGRDQQPQHPESGVFALEIVDARIDEASLSFVCADAPCTRFEVEP